MSRSMETFPTFASPSFASNVKPCTVGHAETDVTRKSIFRMRAREGSSGGASPKNRFQGSPLLHAGLDHSLRMPVGAARRRAASRIIAKISRSTSVANSVTPLRPVAFIKSVGFTVAMVSVCPS